MVDIEGMEVRMYWRCFMEWEILEVVHVLFCDAGPRSETEWVECVTFIVGFVV